MTRDEAPGRPFGRSGALVWGLLLLVLIVPPVLGGCDAMDGGSTIQLDSAEVSVDGEVHEIRIGGSGASDSIAPAVVEASPGDVVRFVSADRRLHAPTFAVDELAPELRQFLEQTGQLRGPPLIDEGASWVVSLEGAPPGSYPFYCRSHDTAGRVTVSSES